MASDPLAKFGEVLYRKQILRLLSLRVVADTAPPKWWGPTMHGLQCHVMTQPCGALLM